MQGSGCLTAQVRIPRKRPVVAYIHPGSTWGAHVAALRQRQGLQQKDLAVRSGVDKSLISRIESGTHTNPSLDTLLGLQRALRLDSIEALLGETPSTQAAGIQVGRRRP